MKSVEGGIINVLSPSMINSFDANQAFGCERRWWYKYVKGLKEESTGNQELGTMLHELVEQRLLTGKTPTIEHEAAGLYLAGQAMIESVAARKIIGVEMHVAGFQLDGTRVQGYIDVVTEDGIIDWKTSSDIRRYGKTELDLPKDTQMVIYALAMHPDLDTVKLAHGQFQTKGRKSTNFVEVEVSQEHLASHRDKVIIPLIQKMKSAAREEDVSKLPRNEKSCFNCTFKSHCPNKESESIMSFFSKMKAPAATPTPPQPEVQKVTPPDQPPSKPELAAVPVEGFQAVPPPRKMQMIDVPAPEKGVDFVVVTAPVTESVVEAPVEAPKKRGRPVGAKNKPKVNTEVVVIDNGGGMIAHPAPNVVTKTKEETAAIYPHVTVKSCTVTKGYTINLGNFNSVRFDIGVTAEGEDLELLYSTLMGEVEERLEAEAAKYEAVTDEKNKAGGK